MADLFCTHCGNPLTGARKFCANCGSPVGGETGMKDRSTALDGSALERLSATIRAPILTPLSSGPELPKTRALPLSQLRAASPGIERPRAAAAPDHDQVVFDRVVEPNENAFTIMVPRGWQIHGGIFNVNPLQVNGPGNTLSPKCDFAIMSDGRGTVMIRWMPSWNYADLTFSPTGGAFFPPGQWYKGMPVRLMVSAKRFLCEMLQAERPRATGMTIVTEDPLEDATNAFYQQAEQVNRDLQRMGLFPLKFESWGMQVEYEEDGQPYWEDVMVTICDNRAGAFMWTNENTFMMRAPAPVVSTWRHVLLEIRNSLETNPQWLAAVEKARGQRARLAWETQQYINRATAEITAKRQKAYEEARRQREQEEARREQQEEAERRRGGDNMPSE
jgi:hypothetical protein